MNILNINDWLIKQVSYINDNFYLRMSKELETFDMFVDDIISSEDNLLKCELDYLLMQYIFESLELDNFKNYNKSLSPVECADSYLVAWKMFKFLYNNFWYPVFGRILSKFVFLIEGSNNKKIKSKNSKKNMNKSS